jgi:hypothetical protein
MFCLVVLEMKCCSGHCLMAAAEGLERDEIGAWPSWAGRGWHEQRDINRPHLITDGERRNIGVLHALRHKNCAEMAP